MEYGGLSIEAGVVEGNDVEIVIQVPGISWVQRQNTLIFIQTSEWERLVEDCKVILHTYRSVKNMENRMLEFQAENKKDQL